MNKSIVMLILVAASLNLHATPVLIVGDTYNTGYVGNSQSAPGAFDNDFSLEGSANPPVVASPIPGAWVTVAGAQWISPSEDQSYPPPPTEGNLPGTYTYETSFENDFLVPTDFTLSGSYAADNTVTIFVNGQALQPPLTSPNSQFSFLTPFSLNFVAPGSTPILVSFAVTNYNTDNSDPSQSNDGKLNPSGLLISNLKLTATPEPSTCAMLFAGLGALVLVTRMRRTTAL
jgi:hypothetical protein